jgi:hypothetical protein
MTAMPTVGTAGGIFLLSFMVICPCFRVKKKETKRPGLVPPSSELNENSHVTLIILGLYFIFFLIENLFSCTVSV